MPHIHHYFNSNSLDEKIWNMDLHKYLNKYGKLRDGFYKTVGTGAIIYGVYLVYDNNLVEKAQGVYETISALF